MQNAQQINKCILGLMYSLKKVFMKQYKTIVLFILSETILEKILSIEATKLSNYPSFEELQENSLFANAIGSISKDVENKKLYLKFSAATKEALSKHKENYENRLQEDHRKVSSKYES